MSLRRRLASQSAIIFAARLSGAGLIFLAQAAIARVWGSAILGEYLLVIATVNLVAVVMPLGFQTIGTYFAAEYRARGEGRMLRRFVMRAYLQAGVAGALVVWLGGPVAAMMGEPGQIIAQFWAPASLIVVATAMIFINGSLLVGLKRPMAGFFADALFRPMLVVGAFLIAAIALDGALALASMLWIFALGYMAVALGHLAITLVSIARVPKEGGRSGAESGRWWRFAAPWVIISLATDFFFDIDLLLLSGMMSREELAIFGVCTRIFALVSFGIAAVYAVTLPDMFESEANSDREGFMRKVGDANLVAAGLSVVLFGLMAIGGPVALLLFGPSFLAGAGPLAVLCLALVVRSIFGPAPLVLSIHDRPFASLPAVACGMGSLGVANFVLVPTFGLMGAALAALFAITLWSGVLWLTARWLAGIDVSVFPRLMTLRAEGFQPLGKAGSAE